jgi:hypothetical protein
MRAWRSPKGILIDVGETRAAVVHTLADDVPAPWKELHEFVLVDEHGIPRETFSVSTWSLDDDLGVSVHAVVDGVLRELTVVQHYGREWTVRRNERSVLDGLQEIPESNAAAWELIRDAVTSKKRLEEHQADQRKKDGEARVAAIPGASETFEAGPEFDQAQRVLRDRVRLYGESLDIDLLRALVRFGTTHRTVRDPAFVAALKSFVFACRRAAFDHTLRRKDPEISTPAAGKPVDARLVETLDALEKKLRAEADVQEQADALMNSREFHLAADHIGRALRCLRR